ncbi:hypothetical protein GEMRC1_004505 [Eukaryota sp. GEM-RC1]
MYLHLLCLAFVALALAETSLDNVILVTRHGDRSPLRTYPNQYASWNCSLNLFSSLHLQHNTVRYPYFRKNYIDGKQSLQGSCFMGQLTSKGALQHFELGKRVREDYHHLLPRIPDHTTYFRSTDLLRTQESLISNLLATFPALASSDIIPDIHLLERTEETMLANSPACPRLSYMLNELHETQEWKARVDKLETLRKKLEAVFGVSVTSIDDWNKGFDYLYALVENNLSLPPTITYRDYEALLT